MECEIVSKIIIGQYNTSREIMCAAVTLSTTSSRQRASADTNILQLGKQ